MKRKETIDKLHRIEFRAIPTVKTLDMGLQYDYMSSFGAGTGILAMVDWPAYKFHGISQEKWEEIRRSLRDKTFNQSFLIDTELIGLYERINSNFDDEKFNSEMASKTFFNLLKLSDEVPETLYCLCDPDNEWSDYHYPVFYEKEDDLLSDFNNSYCLNYTKWEDMDDEDLAYWLGRLNDDLNEFPYYTGKDE